MFGQVQKFIILGREMLHHLFNIVIGTYGRVKLFLGLEFGFVSQDVLSHEENGEKNELQKRLRSPGYEQGNGRGEPAREGKEADEREQSKGVGGPHGPNPFGQCDGHPGIPSRDGLLSFTKDIYIAWLGWVWFMVKERLEMVRSEGHNKEYPDGCASRLHTLRVMEALYIREGRQCV